MPTAEYDGNIDKIIEQMDRKENYYRAPRSSELVQMMKMAWDEDDAALGACMSIVPEGPGKIAEKAGKNPAEVIPHLNKLVRKGLILCLDDHEHHGQKTYSIYCIDPMLLGFTTRRIEETGKVDEISKEFSELWVRYYDNYLGKEAARRQSLQARIIPIEQSVESTKKILSFDQIAGILENATYFAVEPCPCRVQWKTARNGCSFKIADERDFGCLQFSDFGKARVEAGLATEITKERCWEIIQGARDLGLVQSTFNSKDAFAMCNCCSCCCIALRGNMLFEENKNYAPSNYFALIDRKVCDGCKDLEKPVCVDRCPVKVISMKDGKAAANLKKCIGCGLCGGRYCPAGAITLGQKKKINVPHEVFTDIVTGLLQAPDERS